MQPFLVLRVRGGAGFRGCAFLRFSVRHWVGGNAVDPLYGSGDIISPQNYLPLLLYLALVYFIHDQLDQK